MEPAGSNGPGLGDGRTAVVTGSARRVGRAIAERLVADGWLVLVHARDGERAAEAAAQLGATGWVGADLQRAEAAERIASAALDAFDGRGVDLLVNSASSFERVERWQEAGVDGWQRAMAVNARAPYLLVAALLPQLRVAGGLVVNVSDHAAHEHWPAHPVHAASKAALESLTLSGAAALAPDGVRMVAIAPGTILPPDDWDAARVERERRRPGGGVGTPDVLVDAIVELADDPARTGEIVVL